MVEIWKGIKDHPRTSIGVATSILLALALVWANRSGQNRNASEVGSDPTNIPVLPTDPKDSRANPTSTPGPTSTNVTPNNSQKSLNGPCFSLPAPNGARAEVQIGQASEYWGAVCIGVDPDGATHWQFEGHESITYPLAPESPVAKTR